MKYLVLGGRGFIGSHLVDALLAQGHHVRCFDRPHVVPTGLSRLDHPRLDVCDGDFLSEVDVAMALKGCEVCFHLVSTTLPATSNADPAFDIECNVLGTVRMLKHLPGSGLKKIVFVSSGGTVYGIPRELPIKETHPTEPICSYGISKLAIEKHLGLTNWLYGIDYAALRISNPYGERQRSVASQGVVAVFLGRALRGEPIEIWGDGQVVRDYIHIDDVVAALLRAIGDTGAERVFNIGSGQGMSLHQVIDVIEQVVGRRLDRRHAAARPLDVEKNVLCIDRARAVLDWQPRISFVDGVRRFARWMKQSGETGLPF